MRRGRRLDGGGGARKNGWGKPTNFDSIFENTDTQSGFMSRDITSMSPDTTSMSADTKSMSPDTKSMSQDTKPMSRDIGPVSRDIGPVSQDLLKHKFIRISQ